MRSNFGFVGSFWLLWTVVKRHMIIYLAKSSKKLPFAIHIWPPIWLGNRGKEKLCVFERERERVDAVNDGKTIILSVVGVKTKHQTMFFGTPFRMLKIVNPHIMQMPQQFSSCLRKLSWHFA